MIRKTFLATAALSTSLLAFSAYAETFNAAVVIENQAVNITQNTALDFGTLVRPVSGTATFEFFTDATTPVATGTTQTGSPVAAVFTITGDALSAPDISLTDGGSDANTTITEFNVDYAGTTANGTGVLFDDASTPLGAGQTLTVAGEITIGAASTTNNALEYDLTVSYD